MFCKTFVRTVEFDWLPGRQKGKFLKNVKQNVLLINHKVLEADTWHTCL